LLDSAKRLLPFFIKQFGNGLALIVLNVGIKVDEGE